MIAEGGCGVVGFASNKKISGASILQACRQMRNRGNGKGGGVVAIGLRPDEMLVSQEVIENYYLIQIAYLDPNVREDIETNFINNFFDVAKSYEIKTKDINLEVKPPVVYRYFCKVNDKVLSEFMAKCKLDKKDAEDEFVYQNSLKINNQYYASLGDKKAFVLCHGKDLLLFKIVGYAEQAVEYYGLDGVHANIWVGHQRYPTKGRVWHPAGAHPFIGLNEALVHNGDFANYKGVSNYLKQHNIEPQFLTDTEVSALLFDLLIRRYKYPLEYVIEALAPTTERDFIMLPKEKQLIYDAIQKTHVHASPDGPWFFIIARNDKEKQLLGITDTSMLRPQVFALKKDDKLEIGLIGSEKQAIDAALQSIAEEIDISPVADKYWNARGGSYTDGGSFIFTVKDDKLICHNKFGEEVVLESPHGIDFTNRYSEDLNMKQISVKDFQAFLKKHENDDKGKAITLLTSLLDKKYDLGAKKRSDVVWSILQSLYNIFRKSDDDYYYVNFATRDKLLEGKGKTLVIDAANFPPEGKDCLARYIIEANHRQWDKFIVFNCRGQRFVGCGFGSTKERIKIDVYGNCGDYLGSGMDNVEITMHGNAQDQLGQIMRNGKLVVYGDVGQTFLYGAKGGESYVLGNAAGRPLINAVGNPRVVINGTCLDYLAESFMAGDPHNGGGFVIVNGIYLNESGDVMDLDTPYPGGNLFSLASGGAIYIRDPYNKLTEDQLNGGVYKEVTQKDWDLITPYLKENEKLFGVSIKELLTINGHLKKFSEVYKKVEVAETGVLQ